MSKMTAAGVLGSIMLCDYKRSRFRSRPISLHLDGWFVRVPKQRGRSPGWTGFGCLGAEGEENGSQLTRRWRETDSNPRSPLRGTRGTTVATAAFRPLATSTRAQKTDLAVKRDLRFEFFFLHRGVLQIGPVHRVPDHVCTARRQR